MQKIQELLNLFEKHLTVMAIAEELFIFSKETFREEMEKRRYETAVLEDSGQLLKFDKGDEFPMPIATNDTLPAHTSLFETYERLLQKRRFFILSPNGITHIVTRSDLDKIPLRLGVFGLVSVFETFLKEKVRKEVKDWEISLTTERLKLAKRLLEEKILRKEDIDLVQCLQLGDLRTIFSKEKRYRSLIKELKRDKYDKTLKAIVRLRDALAHAQPALPYSWDEIYELVVFMKKIMYGDSKFNLP
ncbi:hypothetical protein [Pleomorphovibrio marinus]|uniref:hypothetical protein n=1 Tax=Pleomorphovibrio marinus TaxID=2164132 RepID=UPI000E0C60FC|nr:hypothetical protein [Pleomorphovibrio marinus]